MPTNITRPEPAKLGLGYRELRLKEAKQAGDEFTVGSMGDWISIPDAEIGCHIREGSVRHRRKIESERQAA